MVQIKLVPDFIKFKSKISFYSLDLIIFIPLCGVWRSLLVAADVEALQCVKIPASKYGSLLGRTHSRANWLLNSCQYRIKIVWPPEMSGDAPFSYWLIKEVLFAKQRANTWFLGCLICVLGCCVWSGLRSLLYETKAISPGTLNYVPKNRHNQIRSIFNATHFFAWERISVFSRGRDSLSFFLYLERLRSSASWRLIWSDGFFVRFASNFTRNISGFPVVSLYGTNKLGF